MIKTLQVIQHQVEKLINHTDDLSLFGDAKDNTMTKALIQCQLGTLMSYIADRIAEFNWKQTLSEVPKDGEKVLVCYNGLYGLLIWNEISKCWDSSEGDAFFCEKECVPYWMRLPVMPKKENK